MTKIKTPIEMVEGIDVETIDNIEELEYMRLDPVSDGYRVIGFGFECSCGEFNFVKEDDEIVICEDCGKKYRNSKGQ